MTILEELNQIQASIERIRAMVTPPPVTLPPKSRGIDVSMYQVKPSPSAKYVPIDWNKVKASGIGFAFVKATESAGYTDPYFQENWAGSRAGGVPRGAYHFYRFSSGPLEQANYFIGKLGSDIGELPPVMDAEDTKNPINPDDLRVFCERVFTLTGKRCIIYTGRWWWGAGTRYLNTPQPWAKDYPLWLAAYVDASAVNQYVPSDWDSWTFWQYSNGGSIPGIAYTVDLDMYHE